MHAYILHTRQLFHPPGESKGVALGEMKRYLRINSCVETFNTFKTKHKVNLRKRGYSCKSINRFTDQVKYLGHLFGLSKKKVTKRLHKIPFVTRFTPSAYSALQITYKILAPSSTTTTIPAH